MLVVFVYVAKLVHGKVRLLISLLRYKLLYVIRLFERDLQGVSFTFRCHLPFSFSYYLASFQICIEVLKCTSVVAISANSN